MGIGMGMEGPGPERRLVLLTLYSPDRGLHSLRPDTQAVAPRPPSPTPKVGAQLLHTPRLPLPLYILHIINYTDPFFGTDIKPVNISKFRRTLLVTAALLVSPSGASSRDPTFHKLLNPRWLRTIEYAFMYLVSENIIYTRRRRMRQ